MKYILTMSMLIAVMSCATTKNSQSGIKSLAGSKWELQQTTATALNAPKKPTIEFDTTQKKIFGNSGCNTFRGAFTADNSGAMSISKSMIMTKMACPVYAEDAFMNKLYQTKQYTIKNGVLQLKDGNVILLEWISVKK